MALKDQMIVISPTADWLQTALRDCASSLTVASPYIGSYFADAVTGLTGKVNVTLLTRTLITDFANRSSDLEAVCKLARRSGGVLSLSSLHAKVYVVDRAKALVTSANATFSGMCRNRECGIEIISESEIAKLATLIHSGFGTSPKPKYWTAEDLEQLIEPVRVLRAALPKIDRQRQESVETLSKVELPRRQINKLIGSFSGWLQLTLEGITRIKSDMFTMEQVWLACLPLIKERYPNNRHSREKLRQQMQRLRDLGLVRFAGRGTYERLAQAR
jgi:hypothetical protein